MTAISLKFDALTADEARVILAAYEQAKSGNFPVVDRYTPVHEPRVNPVFGTAEHVHYVPLADEHASFSSGPQHGVEDHPGTGAQTVAAAGDDFDAAGLPWVAGTHSSSRKKNANGSWALRKGVPDNLAAAYRTAFAHGVNATQNPNGKAPATANPTPAQLNAQFGAPAVPSMPGFPAPEIDYPTWLATFQIVFPKFQSGAEDWDGFLKVAGVADVNEFPTNARARQVTFGIMKQIELK